MIDVTATIHSHALIEKNVIIGARTRIWAFAHLLPEVKVGEDCNICDHTFIEQGVTLGNRVTVKSGVYIWSGVHIADDVFIGPCVAFTNDKRPRSRQYLAEHLTTRLHQGASIGANATLLPGINIGAWSMVGAGSVVTKDVPPHAMVIGNPARIRGWICQCGLTLTFLHDNAVCTCGFEYEMTSNMEINEKVKET